jgi:hypothetical protein
VSEDMNAAIRRAAGRTVRSERAGPSDGQQPSGDIDAAVAATASVEPDMNHVLRVAAGREPAFDVRDLRRDHG